MSRSGFPATTSHGTGNTAKVRASRVAPTSQRSLLRPVFPHQQTLMMPPSHPGTALLNAYLEEWAVLNPNAGNQAFNAQDGTPFTWSRFWPYLASWYGADWTPPEDNPLKYRTTESRWTQTPRG